MTEWGDPVCPPFLLPEPLAQPAALATAQSTSTMRTRPTRFDDLDFDKTPRLADGTRQGRQRRGVQSGPQHAPSSAQPCPNAQAAPVLARRQPSARPTNVLDESIQSMGCRLSPLSLRNAHPAARKGPMPAYTGLKRVALTGLKGVPPDSPAPVRHHGHGTAGRDDCSALPMRAPTHQLHWVRSGSVVGASPGQTTGRQVACDAGGPGAGPRAQERPTATLDAGVPARATSLRRSGCSGSARRRCG